MIMVLLKINKQMSYSHLTFLFTYVRFVVYDRCHCEISRHTFNVQREYFAVTVFFPFQTHIVEYIYGDHLESNNEYVTSVMATALVIVHQMTITHTINTLYMLKNIYFLRLQSSRVW